MIPWIPPQAPPDRFPPASRALAEPDGLLAGGGDLSVPRLLAAYRRGIFPWFSEGQPILWWCPATRAVFLPGRVHVPRRLARWLRARRPRVQVDRDFAAVVEACAAPREPGGGTWITAAMREAYVALHRAGHAHCVEAVVEDRVIGGIYGVAIGRAFFGESMYSAETNGSKAALVGLSGLLAAGGYGILDAQVPSAHLSRLGAELWPRQRFLACIEPLCEETPEQPLGPGGHDLAELLP